MTLQNIFAKFFSLAAATLFVLNASSAQGIRPSEFNEVSADTFWNFVDPRGGANLSMTGTHASIDMPRGLSRDPVSNGQGGNRAPRLVQRVGPPGSDVGDFGLVAKFDGVMNSQFQMQGIEAIQDGMNYVRCEIFSDINGINALLYSFDDTGNYAEQKVNSVPPALGATPLLIRLDRFGNTFKQYYSTSEGASWIFVDSVVHTMNVDSIAVYAASSDSIQIPAPPDTAAPAFTGLIDYIRSTGVLPVQLASFNAVVQNGNDVLLRWMTISETNNYGFNVEKSFQHPGSFLTIPNSFVPGHGTTIDPRSYSYLDQATSAGNWFYRLKQIDIDGTIHYSEPTSVSVLTGVRESDFPSVFALEQNYPNPFNPSTEIGFEVPVETHVQLDVFNLIGQKVASVVNEVKPAGYYKQRFSGADLPSGVYVYKLKASGFSVTKKMLLMK